MAASQSIAAIAEALAKAQSEIKGAVKDSLNPHFKSHFADLSSVWDACRGPLTKNGLAVTQTTDISTHGLTLITTLMHSSGEWISSAYPIQPTQNTPQGMGSALSYSRRYSLSAIVGVVQVDDDGEAASVQPREEPRTKFQPTRQDAIAKQEAPKTPPGVDDLVSQAIAKGYSKSDVGAYFKKIGANSPSEVTEGQLLMAKGYFAKPKATEQATKP